MIDEADPIAIVNLIADARKEHPGQPDEQAKFIFQDAIVRKGPCRFLQEVIAELLRESEARGELPPAKAGGFRDKLGRNRLA